jgi:hypothetical protein
LLACPFHVKQILYTLAFAVLPPRFPSEIGRQES